MEMDEKIGLSSSGLFSSEQLYSLRFLWFRDFRLALVRNLI
jgi:hypothetical protein